MELILSWLKPLGFSAPKDKTDEDDQIPKEKTK
jgi:hypothetical protein